MSVIQKIRTKYAKLAGGVIAVALVAFILMDALSSRSGSLFGDDTSVAKVNGEEIDYIAYSQRTKDYETLYGSQQAIDDNFRAQINAMALEDLIKEELIEEEAEQLGLTVTEAEKKDMIYGNDPDAGVRNYQAFQNPDTKMFDPQYVKLFEEQVDQLDPTGKARQHWETYKAYILRSALTKKYNTLFNAAVYMPKFLVEARAQQQASMANIDYVALNYDMVGDEEVKLTDDDYKKYMKEHKNEYYNQETTRSMEYVAFNVLPAAEDTARALGVLNEIKEDFANAKDDESFVNRNSEESFNGAYRMKSDFQSMYADSVFNMPVGSVFGPVYEGEDYKLMKVLDKKMYPDSVKCRHILVKTADRGQAVLADSIAKQRIDSIAAAIKGGASFAEMVQKYSDDQGSKETGGEYTFPFAQKSGLVKEFSDFIFENKPGQTTTVKVESNGYSGYHYIEILSHGEYKPAIKLATISKPLYAGDVTENEVYAKATEFAGSSTSAEAFDEAVQKNGLQKQIADNIKVSDFTIYGIGPSRDVIKWMYEAETGDVSPVFQMNGKYVVAKLTGIRKEGLMELDTVLRANIEPMVRNQKKAEILAKKYSDKKSLAEIAAAAASQVNSMDSFRGNNSFTAAAGYVPKVVGYSFYDGLKLNTLSKPIHEQSGVYFINVKARYKMPEQDATFAERERQMMEMEAKNSINSEVTNLLKSKAKIKYNPQNF
ncbi:MAG TPA: SurA N-terminal domain-containing protein [Flavipsychrobacter sp.]